MHAVTRKDAEYRMLTDADLDYVEKLRAENERLRKDLETIRDFAQACRGADYYTYEEYGDIATMATEALTEGLGESWWSVPVAREERSEGVGREDG